jgi:hypothetical protein
MTNENFIKLNLLSEKIAYINGFLDAIAGLNTFSNNAMEHWMIEVDIVNDNLVESVKIGVKAPKWFFEATEVLNWKQSLEKDCYYFFSGVLYEILGSEKYYSNSDMQEEYMFFEKYNLKNQLTSFIHLIDNLVSQYQVSPVYIFEIDSRADRYDPYFAHGEINYAFKISDNKLLYLHLGTYD